MAVIELIYNVVICGINMTVPYSGVPTAAKIFGFYQFCPLWFNGIYAAGSMGV